MPSLTSPFKRIARLLVAHIRRLRDSLVMLTAQVRAALARVVGQATGNAVRDALTLMLDGPPPDATASYDSRESTGSFWGQRPQRNYWQRDSYDADDDSESEPGYYRQSDEEATTAEAAQSQQDNVWTRAVAVGCQAAGWWLRKHPGPFSLMAAVGIGVVTGFAALVGGPFMAGASAVATTALGVLALTDAAQSTATLAADAVT
jgi:hypothetical protein